jgi:hypothetical protein
MVTGGSQVQVLIWLLLVLYFQEYPQKRKKIISTSVSNWLPNKRLYLKREKVE